jgi:flagellar motor switch protein FliN/FliY
MAGDPEKISQDEIEELLRQAQMAAGQPVGASAPSPSASDARSTSAAEASNFGESPAASSVGASVATQSRGNFTASRGGGSSAVGDDIQFLINQAEQAIASVDQPVDPAIQGITPFQFRDFGGAPASGDKASLELLRDVDLDVRIELGRTEMYLEDVLKLKRGSVVPLDKLAGDPVDVYVNGRLVARGEVLVLNDNFCVRIGELLSGDESG